MPFFSRRSTTGIGPLAGAHGRTLPLGLLDERRHLGPDLGHLRRVGMQGEVLQGPARVTRTAGLDGGEHELAPDLDVCSRGRQWPDPEPERLLRQALLPEDLDGGGQRAPGRSRSEAVAKRLSACSRSSCTESRPSSTSGYQARPEWASSSRQRPDGVVRGLARVPAPVPLLGPPPDDLGEGVEGLHVVRVLPQDAHSRASS